MNTFFLHHYYVLKRLKSIAVVFVLVQLFLRLSFFVFEISNIYVSLREAANMLALGLVYDLATFSFLLVPYVIYLVVLPQRWHGSRFDMVMTSICYGLLLYIILFDVVAEWVFWDEFSVRFNFIAVDYLVYTQEVLANIWESYPVIWLLAGLALLVWVIYRFTRWYVLPVATENAGRFRVRLLYGLFYLLIPAVFYVTLDLGKAEISHNNYVNEITKNGIFSLFSAFSNNELSYQKFYLSALKQDALPPIRSLLEEEELGQVFVNEDPEDITRFVPGNGAEKHKNVIIVVMESMSGEFMAHSGNQEGLTPNLDALADQALFFENTYATGTRTVRGLEAISLSIPPSPGRSIVKRPNNENLASLGFVFQDRGYDTRFIYGGYGYFDNMNYFFEHNGFGIVDRAKFLDEEQTFANAWGLCDEDLFRKVISEARASYGAGKPFMHMVMTTSNHRPYTFPENEDGIPVSGGGRSAGIRYADYAVGKFIEAAKKEPWFMDTVFIFVADHTAGSAGKSELSIRKYHIPFMIYAPGFITAQKVPNMTSQIDVAPILLGLLDF
ncbi:MAG: sulfatase-like hydrolase/transferase [Hyphomicrobiales bacterium]|nr:sulfatase-like hydrolase/transferase [Hyphomicrobiales bacterium]